jgi:NADP-dependent 3-hydroxy acid dehydrogenase YdfG
MKFKKVAITGHNQGIGKSFFDYYKNKCEVKGFDLSNGYDITVDAQKIIAESMDFDLFINNASAVNSNAQATLADLWYQSHKTDHFFILQISSASVRMQLPEFPDGLKMYIKNKIELESVHNKINLTNNSCKSITVSPGIVETSRVNVFDDVTHNIYLNCKKENSLLHPADIVDVTIKNLDAITDRYFPSLIEICNSKIIYNN